MSRGAAMPDGTETQAKNGYWYVKCGERGWVLKHWLVWEKENGRQVDSGITLRFKDGNKENFDVGNIVAIPKGKVRIRQKIATLTARIKDLQDELDYYEKLLANEPQTGD